MKIVINKCFGGFGLSPLAIQELAKRKGRQCYFYVSHVLSGGRMEYLPLTLEEAGKSHGVVFAFDAKNPHNGNEWYSAHHLGESAYERTDPDLVAVVQDLGVKANGQFAKLAIVEIPDSVEYEIDEYDGQESIHEKHRTWG
jgi:hypothetical protein